MDLSALFGTPRPVVGMVHLPPLPGAPSFDGDRAAVRRRARQDAEALEAGGADAVLVENFGDAPYYPEEVPAHVVASMTALVETVSRVIDLPVGVNVLRNDVASAISIAAATDATFVRANVHTGARVADQGLVQGRAHETLRLRDRLDADLAIIADVNSKHSAPLGETDLDDALVDTVERGQADGIVVTGSRTGRSVDSDELAHIVGRRDELALDVPVFVGSGVTAESISSLRGVADGVIVGTGIKEAGVTTNPVDTDRVRALVDAAKR